MQKIVNIIIKAVIVVLPVFFLTTTAEFYDFNKHAFFAIAIILISFLLILAYARTKKLSVAQSPFNFPVLLFLGASLVTLFINSPNKAESLFFPNGTGTVILITFWYFIILNCTDLKKIYKYLNLFTASAVILSILAIMQYFKLGANLLFPDEKWISQPLWTPVGSPLVLAIFLAAIAPYPIIRAIEYLRSGKSSEHAQGKNPYTPRLFGFSAGAFSIIFALALMTASLFTTAKPVILPFQVGWEVGAETLKSMRTAAFGVGLLNYLPAFTTGHTQGYNALPIWNIRFGVSSNWYLQILTELGIVGLLAFLLIAIKVIKKTVEFIKGLLDKTYSVDSASLGVVLGLLITLAFQIFLPTGFLQLFVLFTFLGLFAKFFVTKYYSEDSSILFYLITVVSCITLFVTAGAMYKVYAAEVHLKNSINAAQKKDLDTMYKQQEAAIRANPYIDKYHAIYAQSNLAVAVALSKKKDLTEGDKQNLSKVLAQAVQSGKNAISTYPPKVNNWENLAGIYRAMIGSVKDSDLWTVQAYQQAIRLDPMNPNIRLALGGVYYGAKNYDVAIEYFTQAANLKPNLANAYYNLSASYREKKDWERASQSMQRVIQIVPASSEDRKKAESELEEIKKNIPAPSNAPQGKELINEGKTGSQIETPVDVPSNVAPSDVIKETPRPSSSPSTR